MVYQFHEKNKQIQSNRPIANQGFNPFFDTKQVFSNPFISESTKNTNPFLLNSEAQTNTQEPVQMKCAECEKEEKQSMQKKENNPIQKACSKDSWQYEYDGCTVPDWISSITGIDKDNPAGGSDTHFALGRPTASGGRACDRHDECYQTCNTQGGREACDLRMYQDMAATCRASSASPDVKEKCMDWASRYYTVLQHFGGSAYSERQEQSCSC